MENIPIGQIRTRPVDRVNDLEQLFQLDTSLEADHVFQLQTFAGSELKLAPVKIASAVEKRFPWNSEDDCWTEGWVLEEGGCIRGFIACSREEWNRRFVIRHFYVDRAERRRGFGRRLMECALSSAHDWGARTVWAETSNVNYPGVIAYQRLGFELCGFDTTLYRGTPSEGEFALFLARDV